MTLFLSILLLRQVALSFIQTNSIVGSLFWFGFVSFILIKMIFCYFNRFELNTMMQLRCPSGPLRGAPLSVVSIFVMEG